MITLGAIIQRFEADYLAQYPLCARQAQRQALNAMKRCRTQLAAQMLAQCGDCGAQRLVPHSCGHRLCPHCQHHESQAWTERQTHRLVPGNYFLVTFTLPAELRALAWQHQRLVYTALVDCAWQTLRTFSQNHKQLRGTPGAVAVLHTHSRQLAFHPHVHMVMPAAALDSKEGLWRSLRGKSNDRHKGKSKAGGYLFNHKALATVFRGKFLAALVQAGLTLPTALPDAWVVDCKGVGNGEKALVYLGRYLYRGVIQEKDILRCENGQVTYRWRDSKTQKLNTTTVSGAQFLQRVLQHVLPRGFRRARNFGFLHPNSKRLRALLQLLVFKRPHDSQADLTKTDAKARAPWLCSCCGAAMVVVRRRILPPIDEPPAGQAEVPQKQ
jgi:hypothetical protein